MLGHSSCFRALRIENSYPGSEVFVFFSGVAGASSNLQIMHKVFFDTKIHCRENKYYGFPLKDIIIMIDFSVYYQQAIFIFQC